MELIILVIAVPFLLAIYCLSWRVYSLGYYSKNKKIKFLSRLCGFIVAFGILQCLR